MKNQLIQNRVITIPQTTGTQIYTTQIKADDCFKYLTGVAAFSKITPNADAIELELRDDFTKILSFSPLANWIKNPSATNFNLQDIFKPLNLEAQGRNFYLDVKVTNCNAFSFVALLRQDNNKLDCIRYDAQTWEFKNPALGQALEITLPADYNFCKGIFIEGGDTANDMFLSLDIFDSAGAIVDPLPLAILLQTQSTNYDNGFFPVDFESKSRQIKVRVNNLGTLPTTYTPTDLKITFLLV